VLEIRKNRFSKPFENDFFRILATKLSVKFDALKLNGVLIGSPVCTKSSALQLDALLITDTGITIIDFKNRGGQITLPNANTFDSGSWTSPSNRKNDPTPNVIQGGSGSKNPFKQIQLQKEKLNSILTTFIQPYIKKGENIETKDTYSIVCFQQPITLIGSIPSHLQRIFYIVDPNSIIKTISDLFDVTPNEWQGKITGYKLSTNVFDQIKKIFLADSYDPFVDNSLYAEFDKIKFPEIEAGSQLELIDAEFEKLQPKVEEFIKADTSVLIVNCDITSFRLEFIEKLTTAYLTLNGDDSENTNIESKVCFLAPNNRHVSDLVRLGAPGFTSSLYGKLYDYEHSTIELLSNSMNEKEVFPLLENKEATGMLYVIFNAHLVYNFEAGAEDLVKFGSGSLCNDTLKYLDINNRKNKVILVNDPFFYGHRAETIATNTVLESNKLKYLEVELSPRPLEANKKNISDLIKNLNQNNFSHFSFNKNPNINFIHGENFKKQLEKISVQNLINGISILTREKSENKGINSWIRKNKGVLEKNIQKGDVIWIRNRAIVPEETDPFSIPKHVLSGDIGEVLEISDRYSFSSTKYKFEAIEVTKCKIKLKDYESIRILYVSTNSVDDISNYHEFKKHIQIRCREIVDDYLETNKIEIKDILQPQEFEEYMKQKKQLSEYGELFNREDEESDDGKIDKKSKKLDAEWKINKRKELYVKSKLIKDINSEYFKISQLVHFDFAWAVSLKSCYGYQFEEIYLVEYTNALKNIERFHQFLYSAVGCSEKLNIHNFSNINPWFSINTGIVIENIPNVSEKSQVLVQIKAVELDEKDRIISEKYKLTEFDAEFVLLCRWVHNKLEGKTEFILQSIDHSPYQEKYHFANGAEKSTLILSYNKNWEIKAPKNNTDSEVYRCIIETSNDSINEPYLLIKNENWQTEELSKLQASLQSRGAFIYHLVHEEWKFEIKVSSESDSCTFLLFYNKSGFFSNINIISCSGVQAPAIILESIKELKSE
jgi:hypothetical protein